MQKHCYALGAIAAAVVLLSGCGGGSDDAVGGGTTISPGVTIAVESAPPVAVTFAGGDVVELTAAIASYKVNMSSIAWTVVPATAGAPDLVLANASCASTLKQDSKGVGGLAGSVWECSTSAPAPLLSQPVSYKVTVTGKDAGGMSASATSVVTIAPPGPMAEAALKPIIIMPSAVQVTGGEPAGLTCYGAPGRSSLSKTLTYAWRIKQNPSGLALTLTDADKGTVKFDPPAMQAGKSASVTLECVVTDVSGASTSSDVQVVISPEDQASPGGAPRADSTGAITMTPGIESQLSCFGSGGYTTATKNLVYQWVIKSNPSGMLIDLAGADSATVRVKPGVLPSANPFETVVLQCRVTDAANKTGTVDVTVKVQRPTTAPVPVPTAIANAGAAQSVNVGDLVSLNGSGTRISAGGTGELYYAWSQVSGPSVILSSANTANPSFKAPSVSAPTALRFMLTAATQPMSAGYVPKTGEVSFVDVYVGAILAPRITLPMVTQVAPGTPAELTAALEGNTENRPVYYRWTQVSGTTVTIQTANTASISFFAPAADGDLIFRVQASFDPQFSAAATTSSDALFRVKS